jgi:hypothetical protein
MKTFFKNLFEAKRSEVSFNSKTQIFEVADNAKSIKGLYTQWVSYNLSLLD